MSALSPVLRLAVGNRLHFWCPGCNRAHGIQFGEGPGPRWIWDGNAEAPTFSPSVLVSYEGSDANQDGAPPRTCHSFVRNGRIEFLSDCTHALAGQVVDLPTWPNYAHDGDRS